MSRRSSRSTSSSGVTSRVRSSCSTATRHAPRSCSVSTGAPSTGASASMRAAIAAARCQRRTESSHAMTEPQAVAALSQPSPLSAVGSLVAARDLEELALAAALCPAQLLGARETVVVLRSSNADIVERNPAAAGSELEQWALAELRQATRPEEPSQQGSRLAVGIDPVDGWSGVIAVNVRSPDDETARGLVELGR